MKNLEAGNPFLFNENIFFFGLLPSAGLGFLGRRSNVTNVPRRVCVCVSVDALTLITLFESN